jgi:hypothetical protein
VGVAAVRLVGKGGTVVIVPDTERDGIGGILEGDESIDDRLCAMLAIGGDTLIPSDAPADIFVLAATGRDGADGDGVAIALTGGGGDALGLTINVGGDSEDECNDDDCKGDGDSDGGGDCNTIMDGGGMDA